MKTKLQEGFVIGLLSGTENELIPLFILNKISDFFALLNIFKVIF